jgi:hypothetical protein
MIAANYDLFPTNFEILPMELFDIPYKIRDLAFRDKDLYDDRVYRNLIDSGLPIYERGISFEFSNLELYFDTEGGNILSKSHLVSVITGSRKKAMHYIIVSSQLYCFAN